MYILDGRLGMNIKFILGIVFLDKEALNGELFRKKWGNLVEMLGKGQNSFVSFLVRFFGFVLANQAAGSKKWWQDPPTKESTGRLMLCGGR